MQSAKHSSSDQKRKYMNKSGRFTQREESFTARSLSLTHPLSPLSLSLPLSPSRRLTRSQELTHDKDKLTHAGSLALGPASSSSVSVCCLRGLLLVFFVGSCERLRCGAGKKKKKGSCHISISVDCCCWSSRQKEKRGPLAWANSVDTALSGAACLFVIFR